MAEEGLQLKSSSLLYLLRWDPPKAFILSTSEVSMLRIPQRTGRSEVFIYMSLSKDISLHQLYCIAVVTQWAPRGRVNPCMLDPG